MNQDLLTLIHAVNGSRRGLTATAVIAISVLLTITPQRSSALEFQCELPGDTRYLRVNIPGEDKLCEVRVEYEYNGENKVLWHAQNDTSFCAARAYELRDKYVDTWKYTCTTWPDRDGIDKLTITQRKILDRQLKALIERGRSSDTPYRVKAVKAVASTTLDGSGGLIALQFFLDNGADYTEIINDDGSQTWELMTSVDRLANKIDSDVVVDSALIHAISETGALEIHTTVSNKPGLDCFGTQVLGVLPAGDVSARTPHQYVCHEAMAN